MMPPPGMQPGMMMQMPMAGGGMMPPPGMQPGIMQQQPGGGAPATTITDVDFNLDFNPSGSHWVLPSFGSSNEKGKQQEAEGAAQVVETCYIFCAMEYPEMERRCLEVLRGF